jgi:spore coat protein A
VDDSTLAAGALPGVSEPTHATLTPFRDPLRIPPTLRPGANGVTEIDLVEARLRLHSQMPPTRLWTYRGHFPGPTIEARSGHKFRVAWNNELSGTMPVKAVWVHPEGPGPGLLPYNRPGSAGSFARPEIDSLTAWTSVHRTAATRTPSTTGPPSTESAPATGSWRNTPTTRRRRTSSTTITPCR